jgi:NAD(P)-dependent dehydrogenase (short-subunit alcohol dehydrogenase family)
MALTFTCAAIEGFTEALRLEVDPAWNIKITAVQPGGYATGFEKGMQFFPHHPAYDSPHMPNVKLREMFKDFKGFEGDPEKLVQVLYFKLARSDNPPHTLPLGHDVQAMVAGKLKSRQAEVDAYKVIYFYLTWYPVELTHTIQTWSDGLKLQDPPLDLP